jgi:hypothetical protein
MSAGASDRSRSTSGRVGAASTSASLARTTASASEGVAAVWAETRAIGRRLATFDARAARARIGVEVSQNVPVRANDALAAAGSDWTAGPFRVIYAVRRAPR